MKSILQTFHTDESGAITVDWVTLSAAVMALMFLIMSTIGGAAEGHATWLQTTMANMM